MQRDREDGVGRAAAGEQLILGALAEILSGERLRALHADVAEPVGVLLLAVPHEDDLRRCCAGAGSVRYD